MLFLRTVVLVTSFILAHVILSCVASTENISDLRTKFLEANSAIISLGNPCLNDSMSLQDMRLLIYNHAQNMMGNLEWEEATQHLEFTPVFSTYTAQDPDSRNLTMLEATMYAITASNDLFVAIANIDILKGVMRPSEDDKYGLLPSSVFVKKYLSADKSSFRLGRFEKAIDELVNSLDAKLLDNRRMFIKQVSQYVDTLQDSYKLELEEEIMKEMTLISADGDVVPPSPPQRRYRVVGPTAEMVNTELTNMVVTYLYIPMVLGTINYNLFEYVSTLTIDDAWAARREELIKYRANLESRIANAEKLDEREMLVDLYVSFNGSNWLRRKNWPDIRTRVKQYDKSSWKPVEEWEGVVTDRKVNELGQYIDDKPGNVIALNLPNNNLVGSFPRKKKTTKTGLMYRLSKLEVLDLSYNYLTGTIPAVLNQLNSLVELRVSHNQLEGVLPLLNASDFPNLKVLYAAENRMEGDIGRSHVYDLLKLTHLSLSNNFFNGSLSNRIANLANLVGLDLSDNRLTGTLPSGLGSLSALTILGLNNNTLVGELPLVLFSQCKELVEIHMHINGLVGRIPSEISNLEKLEVLYLHSNALSHAIPAEIGLLPHLVGLDLSSNLLGGVLPPALSLLSELTHLVLHSNKFIGPLPGALSALTNLKIMYLFGNELTGPIPGSLLDLDELQVLYLDNNKFTGRLPGGLAGLTNLLELGLSGNQLTGPLPPRLSKLRDLQMLVLHDNQFSGTLPSTFSNMRALEGLSLNGNELSGTVPSSFAKLTNLAEFMVHDNSQIFTSQKQLNLILPSCQVLMI